MNKKYVNWNDLPWQDMWTDGNVRRKVLATGNMTVSYNKIDVKHMGNPHSHPQEQLIIFFSGEADLYVGGEKHHMTKDSIIYIPPNVEHYAIPTGEEAIIGVDIFYPERSEYVREYTDFLREKAGTGF